MTPEAIKIQIATLKKACKKTPMVLSAQSGQGVQEALRALAAIIEKARNNPQPEEAPQYL
jgi:GTP-binding protein